MGIKRIITLKKLHKIFPYNTFKTIFPTSEGIMDTTYVVDNYILKFYERDISNKIDNEIKLLQHLQSKNLNVSNFVTSNKNHYLYTKLEGTSPKTTKTYHIQALARFMASFHNSNYKPSTHIPFFNTDEIKQKLTILKRTHYFHYKHLQKLQNYTMPIDGFIHADIFKDNTLFFREKTAVIDFIDGAMGSYIFDIAVALISFNPNNKSSFNKLFLDTYNQHAPSKRSYKELYNTMLIAANYYALLRLDNKNIEAAQILIQFSKRLYK